MRLTGSGWAVVGAACALLTIGVVVDYPELVALGLCGVVLVVTASAWVAVRLKIRVQRLVRPTRVEEGDPVTCELTVSNESRHASPDFELTETVAGRPLRLALRGLPGRSATQVHHYELPTHRRGVYQLPAPSIDRLDPARLVRRGFAAGEHTTFYVHPRYHRLVSFGAGGLRDIDGRGSHPRMGGVAFYSLRPYVPGDDRRLIHWPSTARLGSLMVRHNTLPDAPGYLLVLDTAEGRFTDASFEEAVRVTASLCVAAIQTGSRLQLRTTDHRFMPSPPAGARPSVASALDFLAGVTLQAHDVAWPAILTCNDDVVGVTVVTGRLDPAELSTLTNAAAEAVAMAVIQLDQRPPSMATPSSRVLVLTARTSAEFADYWNGRLRR